jgi:hypothetical protein
VDKKERREYEKQWVKDHPAEYSQMQKNWRDRNKIACRIRAIRHRAKKNGTPFSITKEDVIVPSTCPILGIPLFYSHEDHSPNSPSIDRIIPDKGYVPGNIQVISMRANTIKHNATFLELVRVGEWAKAQIEVRGA